MEPYCFQGYWCIAGKMTGYCVFECKKKIPPPPKGVAVGILGGQKNKKSGKCHELSRKEKKIWPTPPRLGVKISKVREISWTAEKIDKYFFTPPGGNFRGSKKQVREMSWTAEKSHKKMSSSRNLIQAIYITLPFTLRDWKITHTMYTTTIFHNHFYFITTSPCNG